MCSLEFFLAPVSGFVPVLLVWVVYIPNMLATLIEAAKFDSIGF